MTETSKWIYASSLNPTTSCIIDTSMVLFHCQNFSQCQFITIFPFQKFEPHETSIYCIFSYTCYVSHEQIAEVLSGINESLLRWFKNKLVVKIQWNWELHWTMETICILIYNWNTNNKCVIVYYYIVSKHVCKMYSYVRIYIHTYYTVNMHDVTTYLLYIAS